METQTKKVNFHDAPAAYQAAVREHSPSAVGADVAVAGGGALFEDSP